MAEKRVHPIEKTGRKGQITEMGSRKFPRWLKGLLRDSELAVRRAAAKFIGDLDYFMATDDLKQAIEDEKDEQTKQLFQHVLDKLRVDDP
jgi:HEAT repeat protein